MYFDPRNVPASITRPVHKRARVILDFLQLRIHTSKRGLVYVSVEVKTLLFLILENFLLLKNIRYVYGVYHFKDTIIQDISVISLIISLSPPT